jgi:flagellar hook protein FlgE
MGFQQGLSGLNTTSRQLEVIGDNIANGNTFGSKWSRAEFSDIYSTALNSAGTDQGGAGVRVSAVAQQFTQGNITNTNNPLDLAISGPGFFQVVDVNNTVNYTRNGQFKVNSNGFVVNNQGLKLIGYPADANGVIQPGTAQPLRLPTAGLKPTQTANISMEFNLDAREIVTADGTITPAINFTDPSTYNVATSLKVYDAKGQDVSMTYYFQKSATDTWDVYVSANGIPLQTTDYVSGTTTLQSPAPSFRVTFAADGGSPQFSPITPVAGNQTTPGAGWTIGTAASQPPALTVPSTNGSNGVVTLSISPIALSMNTITQYRQPFAVTDQTQDGYPPGQLVGVQFETNGVITARYSNGQTKSAGQVEIANFRNPQGLIPRGGNSWVSSVNSGTATTGVPGDGILGALQPAALEESNVDMTQQLVEMITAQRAYQANAQTIKTQDQILQTLVSLR